MYKGHRGDKENRRGFKATFVDEWTTDSHMQLVRAFSDSYANGEYAYDNLCNIDCEQRPMGHQVVTIHFEVDLDDDVRQEEWATHLSDVWGVTVEPVGHVDDTQYSNT
jgi:hypothetical protein